MSFVRFLNRLVLLVLGGLLALAFAVIAVLFVYGRQLPDHQKLRDYELPMTTRLFAADGEPIARYAVQHRLFQNIEDLPPHLIDAFLSAEDRFFWQHHGLDGRGLARAIWHNLLGALDGSRPQGGSTITQQVSKNFLLTNEVTLRRKVKELLLSFRLERSLSKRRILELYLNGIYLGSGNWGVTAASLYYFGRLPQQLSIAEAAYLAALPKAPNNYHPLKNHQRAVARRNWIIGRMLEDRRITAAEAERAKGELLRQPAAEAARSGDDTPHEPEFAAYFSEEVRRRLSGLFGSEMLYQGGLVAHTSLDPQLQKLAERSLRRALIAYDRNLGWRTEGVAESPPLVGWRRATITGIGVVDDGEIKTIGGEGGDAAIIFADGASGLIPAAEWRWAMKAAAMEWDEEGRPTRFARPAAAGDEVYVERLHGRFYALRQIPKVSGAIVAMGTHGGRVRALYGGFSQRLSEYNRATQAMRQPGSAFKPVVFLAALEQGFRPTDTLPDAPFIHDQGGKFGIWRPTNFGGVLGGIVTLEEALAKSLNLATVRLARRVGVENVRDTAIRLGLYEDAPPNLSIALGSQETTLLKLTAAYATFANGGYEVIPSLIDYIQDRHGNTLYPQARGAETEFSWQERRRLIAPQNAARLNEMLRKVISDGTARRAITVETADLGGKTGTSNNSNDAWFIGFTPKLAVGVFVGYDNPRSLGKYVGGSSLAAPIFNDFIGEVLATAEGRARYGGKFMEAAEDEYPGEYAAAEKPPIKSLDEPLGLY